MALWFTPDKQRFDPTEDRRANLRATLAQAEVLIITLGLAETWFDVESGARLVVIRGLETACDERLAVIEQLQAEIDRLKAASPST